MRARLCAKPLQLCPIICDPMDRSMLASSVLHRLLESAQIHIQMYQLYFTN